MLTVLSFLYSEVAKLTDNFFVGKKCVDMLYVIGTFKRSKCIIDICNKENWKYLHLKTLEKRKSPFSPTYFCNVVLRLK